VNPRIHHPRAAGTAHVGGGLVLTTCGLLTLRFGGKDAKTYAWAATFFALAALDLAAGIWELMSSRSASPRL
jgi:hypothetical protein